MTINDYHIEEFWKQHSEWSQKTFGLDKERGPIGPLKHLEKEIQEVLKNIRDIEEYADCLFLIFDATRRAGFTLEGLIDACFIKLEKNKNRKWYDTGIPDSPIEHKR